LPLTRYTGFFSWPRRTDSWANSAGEQQDSESPCTRIVGAECGPDTNQ
jgi:hypothetical protein